MATQGQWAGSWQGSWFGALEIDPGAMSADLSGSGGASGDLQGVSDQVTGGHYFDWWRKKWEAQFKAPTVEEVEEFVKESPVQALDVLREVAPSVARGVTPALLASNAKLLESIAQQLHIAIKLKRIQLDEEDDEEALLMMV